MLNKSNHIPKIMGILNGTPDSFFQDSRVENILHNEYNFKKADILDVGFESSRPGALPLDEKYEIRRKAPLTLPIFEYRNNTGNYFFH